MNTSLVKRSGIAFGLGCVLALAALVLALAAADSQATRAPSLAEQFSVVHAVPAQGDASSDLSGWLDRLETPPGGGDEEVSAVGTTELGNGDRAAVAISGQRVCVSDLDSQAGTCGNAELATEGRAFVAVPAGCGHYEVLGLVPDGVESLAVDEGGDGTVDRVLEVGGNVYSATLLATATVISSSDGAVDVTLPLDWYAADNEAC